MANDELKYRGTDLRRSPDTMWFWIEQGWIDDVVNVRGVDTVVPGLAGRTRRNRRADNKYVILQGWIRAPNEYNIFAFQQEIQTLANPTLNPANLVVGAGYKGLAAGQTATIAVRTLNINTASSSSTKTPLLVRYSWELECIDNDPGPDWVIAP